MTKFQRSAQRRRRLILAGGLLYTLAALFWIVSPLLGNAVLDRFSGAGFIGTPFYLTDRSIGPFSGIDIYSASIVLFLGMMAITQWMFLRPAHGWMARLAFRGRPLKSAVMAAALMAAFLSFGLIAIVLELFNQWEPIVDGPAWKSVAGIWGGMGFLWVLWSVLFFVYWRQGDRYTQLGKMIRGLVAGSMLEAFVAVPVHVWATRQRECYCMRGTYTTLVLAGTVLLWAFGPGIVLLYLREKHRYAKLWPACSKCGYDLRGNRSGICPECGTPIQKS